MIENLDGTREIVNYHNNVSIRVYENDAIEDYPTHWHGETEIIMPLDNEYYFEIDGEVKTLLPSEILIIPPGQLHTLYSPPKGKRLIILFDTKLVSVFKEFDTFFLNIRPYIVISKENYYDIFDQLKQLILEVATEYNLNNTFKEATCYSLLIKFLALFARNNKEKELADIKRKKNYTKCHYNAISTVCSYINNNYSKKIKIEDLALMTGYSVFHFSRLFKEYNGETVYSYLIKIRIIQAERFLLNQELTIIQVANLSGFDSIATFNRVFKKQKKCTPTEFIALSRNA